MPEPRPINPKHFYAGPPVPRARTGFILMPFKGFEPVHEAIRTAIKNAGLTPQRADDIFTTGAVLEKILRQIAEAEVVVADLTGKNANVFYETGIAHTVKDNVVLLAQKIEDIPVDLRPFEYIVYEQDPDGLQTLSERLGDVIAKLEPESFPGQVINVNDMSPADIKRELRRLLQACEQEWLGGIMPAQIKVFQEDFQGHMHRRQTDEDPQKIVAEAIRTIQPEFLRPWHRIEELGFEIIDQEKDAAIHNMVESLERAYLLPQKWRGPDAPYVAGHGPLLALRTWVLWGAYALDSENWKAVDILLHDRVNYGYDRSGPIIDAPSFFYPKAAGGNIGTAIDSVYAQSDSFSERHFGDTETMKVFIAFWMFATDMAMDASDSWMLSTWGFSPRDRFDRVVARLENELEYAQHFTKHVAHSDPASLDQNWQNGLRKRLVDRKRLGSGYWGWDPPKLPQRFAE